MSDSGLDVLFAELERALAIAMSGHHSHVNIILPINHGFRCRDEIAQLTDLRGKNDALWAESEVYLKRAHQAEAALADLRAENTKLLHDALAQQGRADSEAGANVDLQAQLTDLRRELDQVCRIERQAQVAFNACLNRAEKAEAELTDLRGERDKLLVEVETLRRARDKRIGLMMQLGQILGPDYDGTSFDEVASELVALRGENQALRDTNEAIIDAASRTALAQRAEIEALRGAGAALPQQIAVCHEVLAAVDASVDLSLDEAIQAKVDALLVNCEQEACITWNRLAARANAAEENLAALQHQLDELHGAKFSDRVYHALKSRAETAEADLARLRSRGQALVQQLEETATWLEGFDEPAMATAVEIELVRDAHVMAKRLREACADALSALRPDAPTPETP